MPAKCPKFSGKFAKFGSFYNLINVVSALAKVNSLLRKALQVLIDVAVKLQKVHVNRKSLQFL